MTKGYRSVAVSTWETTYSGEPWVISGMPRREDGRVIVTVDVDACPGGIARISDTHAVMRASIRGVGGGGGGGGGR